MKGAPGLTLRTTVSHRRVGSIAPTFVWGSGQRLWEFRGFVQGGALPHGINGKPPRKGCLDFHALRDLVGSYVISDPMMALTYV